MKKKLKKYQIVLIIITIFAMFVWLNNTSLFYSSDSSDYKYVAHRGLAQTFDVSKVDWDTNTAEIIYEPAHEYLENTIESMRAAFDYGADIVEFDIQITKDKQLAVFHDNLLEYRTDGNGNIKDYTMEELRKLDIGYGYTADNGKTYPFRGNGIGLMPRIEEVLEAFANKELLIHIKDDYKETAELLWSYLNEMTKERRSQITVYGGDESIAYLRKQSASLKVMSSKMLKSALLKYELLGWTGYIPKELHNMELHIPFEYAKFIWGWPYKFIYRMEKVNTRVVIVMGNGNWSEGFDNLNSLSKVPPNYGGYIWTNRIDKVNKIR